MPQLAIQLDPRTAAGRCGLCGCPNAAPAGTGPSLTHGGHAVCRACGQKHAPSLLALLDLAGVARRVGRIRRHTLVPPFEALLDLARAAETYTTTAGEPERHVA